MGKYLSDLGMYKCILVLRCAARVTLAGLRIRVTVSRRCRPVSVCDSHSWCLRNDGDAVPLEFNPLTQCLLVATPAPGTEWLLWHQIGVRRRRTRMWFYKVIIHNHAKGMKSVMSLFQRCQQNKCVNTWKNKLNAPQINWIHVIWVREKQRFPARRAACYRRRSASYRRHPMASS